MITYLLFTKIQQKYSSDSNCERYIDQRKKERGEEEGGGARKKEGKERTKEKERKKKSHPQKGYPHLLSDNSTRNRQTP